MLLLTLFFVLITLLCIYNHKKHTFWAKQGVYSPPSLPLIGHMFYLMSPISWPWKYVDDVYKKAKSFHYFGVYELFSPKLVVFEPELIRKITVKDFDHFVDRRTMELNSCDAVFNNILTNIAGEKWKFIRNILTPSFTSGKLKAMFSIVSDLANEVSDICENSSKENASVDMRDISGRFALDVIASCAFGIDGNTIPNGQSEFFKLMQALTKFKLSALPKFLVFLTSSKLFRILNLSFLTKDMTTLLNIVKNTLNERRINPESRRGDFLDLIIEAQKNLDDKSCKYEFSDDSMIAQSILFILAGYDTATNTLSFVLNDLAKHPDIQEKVRQELREAGSGDRDFTYQSVMEAKYLDACLSESMRLTPTAYLIERKCTQEYKIPESEVVIPVNSMVHIPTWSLHHDAEYWDDPSEFRPSRFLPENDDKIVPYTYLPFGIGPRNCIGNRFALMEMKTLIAKLILNFEMTIAPGFEMHLAKTPQTIRPDDKGVLINFKSLR